MKTISARSNMGPRVSNMSQTGRALFEGGPPLGLQQRVGIVTHDRFNVGRRAVFVAVIGWIPLILLTTLQSLVLHTGDITSFLWDLSTHARYLIAAPLLILAEGEGARRLSAIAEHFVNAGLVTDRDRPRYNAAIESTRTFINSNAAEIIVIVLAYLLVAVAAFSNSFDQNPVWQKTVGLAPAFSPAGWWYALVSVPLLLILLLGWMWRLALWARLLWLIAQLDLRLMASHPDRAAGLVFVGYSVRAFSVVALALATIIAGRSAHIVVLGGTLPTQYFIFNGGLLLAVVALFVAPLLVFTPTLMKTWQRSALEYGALAERVGSSFEDKWLGHGGQVANSMRDMQEFSTTTDLYSIVGNVYALRLVPIDAKSVVMFGIATLFPFVPVVFLALPADQILAALKKLLF